ncbi:uncharacterized protein PGTG_07215 [Puccinia graminis f. sp. tritici CRL 75-36-700-3]|uniref:Uncharacterized protein n=1 Tax=Puccinia graminis f. sp. tritici (strain CRL 75-36-700-3 / race SCCL) TaxID=418459 RepID=E3K9V9_PUCGT|nr:uncharacterized protein PGTG_07215 [Puccinia graminis f. sp. tritici CRL 75-36-700-3]EFP80963.1 hypothetical protein PGTG_07215 [Puccinia graminis f. sp. tritici CRL 75-36-700-3]
MPVWQMRLHDQVWSFCIAVKARRYRKRDSRIILNMLSWRLQTLIAVFHKSRLGYTVQLVKVKGHKAPQTPVAANSRLALSHRNGQTPTKQECLIRASVSPVAGSRIPM